MSCAQQDGVDMVRIERAGNVVTRRSRTLTVSGYDFWRATYSCEDMVSKSQNAKNRKGGAESEREGLVGTETEFATAQDSTQHCRVVVRVLEW